MSTSSPYEGEQHFADSHGQYNLEFPLPLLCPECYSQHQAYSLRSSEHRLEPQSPLDDIPSSLPYQFLSLGPRLCP